jgi:hypothetical protein
MVNIKNKKIELKRLLKISCVIIPYSALMICFGIIMESNMNQQIPKYLQIAQEVADSHTYDVKDYNCVNYSQTLVTKLKEEGYDAWTVNGTAKIDPYCKINKTEFLDQATISNKDIHNSGCIQTHMWVEVVVPIEATLGVEI